MPTDSLLQAPGQRRRTVVGRVLLVLVVLALGVVAGAWGASMTRWDDGVAHLSPTPGTHDDEVRFVTLDDGDSRPSTGFSPEWITWIDAYGTWHEGGLPDCVTEGATVRYAWEKASAAGGSWRETVLVDCRA